MNQASNDSTRRVMDGVAWAEFCDALKAAGATILGEGSPNNPLDRAEGFRYLSRLARAGLEGCIEYADPQAPELLRLCHETIKMGADNPDNLYQSAPIRGKYAYRISGTRGTVHYLGLGTYEGGYGATGSMPLAGYIELPASADPERKVEILVSCTAQAGDWLPMTEASRSLVVRQTFLDRAREQPARLRIERIDGAHVARPLSARNLDTGLRAAGNFVQGCAALFSQWAARLEAHPNQLPKFDAQQAESAGGDPHITYYHGYWKLGPDQALVIDVTPPRCDYWNFQLNNHWMESLDYRYHQISVNKHSAKRHDGAVRIVVAHTDPGSANWIDTCGHERGTMCLRWVRAETQPEPTTRVVALAELRGLAGS